MFYGGDRSDDTEEAMQPRLHTVGSPKLMPYSPVAQAVLQVPKDAFGALQHTTASPEEELKAEETEALQDWVQEAASGE